LVQDEVVWASEAAVHGIWGGLSERERRALRAHGLRASRRERDRAILAAQRGRVHGRGNRPLVRHIPDLSEPDPVGGRRAGTAGMSRSVVCTPHMWPPIAHPGTTPGTPRVRDF
jgi:hypothetical protein